MNRYFMQGIPLAFLLFGIGLIVSLQATKIPQAFQPGQIPVLPNESYVATTSFSYACTTGSAATCNYAKLGNVLSTRALQPEYKQYSDSETGISFYYPSSIATVSKKTIVGTMIIFGIERIMPAPVYTEFWNGASISVEDCQEVCSQNVMKKDDYAAGTEFELVTKNLSAAGHVWTEARITGPMGDTSITYQTISNGKLITYSSDVEDWGPDINPSIYKAFHHILETLKF